MRNFLALPVGQLLLAVAFAVAAAMPSRAETVIADLAGVSPGQTVSVTYNGTPLRNIQAGVFNWTNVDPSNTFLGSNFQSFCIELDVDVLPRSTFTTQPLTPRFNETTANRLREFWGENFAKVGGHANNAASFQLGIWEIVTDGSGASLDLANGNFTTDAAPNGVAQAAQSWLSAVDGQGTFEDGLIVLDSLRSQNQITRHVVPVPPAVILGAMGLASFVGYGVRRRKLAKKAAAA